MTATFDEAAQLLESVSYAAHMPSDYEHGLPAWINHLYLCYIAADISPHVQADIESGRLTFPNAPIWKQAERLQAELDAAKGTGKP